MAAAPAAGATGWWPRDGGIFSYGDAPYYGSLGGTALPGPVGRAWRPRRAGGGYWLAARLRAAGRQGGRHRPRPQRAELQRAGVINQPVFNGTGDEPCDTTGTATASGYTEAQFNFNVATYLQADLEAEGATVVMTRTNNDGVGPVRDHPGGHHQQRPRGRRGRHPRRRRAGERARLHRPRAVADGPNDGVIALLGRLRHDPARRLRSRARRCRSATTTASTA